MGLSLETALPGSGDGAPKAGEVQRQPPQLQLPRLPVPVAAWGGAGEAAQRLLRIMSVQLQWEEQRPVLQQQGPC